MTMCLTGNISGIQSFCKMKCTIIIQDATSLWCSQPMLKKWENETSSGCTSLSQRSELSSCLGLRRCALNSMEFQIPVPKRSINSQKHMRRCSTLSVIRETQMRATVRYFTPPGIAIIKKTDNKCWRGYGDIRFLKYCW